MINDNSTAEEAFTAVLTKAPKNWLEPTIKYKRWTKSNSYNRYGYYRYRTPFKNVDLEEGQLLSILKTLNPNGVNSITEGDLQNIKKVPAANKLLTTMQLNFTNEFLKTAKNALLDKRNKRQYEEEKAEKKIRDKERKEKAREIAKEKKAAANKIFKEKAAKLKEKKQAAAKRLKEKATKNAELMKSLFLTPEQKAILKKIAG